MQRNEERLRTVLQGSSLGFMEANSKLQITNVNAAVCVRFLSRSSLHSVPPFLFLRKGLRCLSIFSIHIDE